MSESQELMFGLEPEAKISDEGRKARDEAFQKIVSDLTNREQIWLSRIASFGVKGVTADKLSELHGLPQNQFSGRITSLVDQGLVKRTKQRRETRAGCKASVLIARQYLPEEEKPILKDTSARTPHDSS